MTMPSWLTLPAQPERAVAHTPRPGESTWHDLAEHLLAVSRAASHFANPFGAATAAYWLGLFHDLGKINPQFQHYLRSGANKRDSVPHAIWGAALLYRMLRPKGQWHLALPVLGHHAGLHDAGHAASELEKFCHDHPEALAEMTGFVSTLLQEKVSLSVPSFANPHMTELWLRMLFSALVDADFLDTEAHFDPGRQASRGRWPSLDDLQARFASERRSYLGSSKGVGDVARIREEVYATCIAQAARDHPHQVFRLTVPTGGGKTLSGLAFALEHAKRRGLRKIIFAVPYTSITTQTAKVYRDILGADAVLEHHSAIEQEESPTELQDVRTLRRQLASENWDAPLVVTTTVQLFESLFARGTRKCRKLHNLAGSVIVLDEAQTLPPELLRPTLNALRLLVEHFGTSVVFCTATQPAFAESRYLEDFKQLTPIEIVPNYAEHFSALRRVTYERRSGCPSWQELAEEITGRVEKQIMVVLNSRKDALALLQEVQARVGAGGNVFHLSTLLCGAHRQALLAEITRRLCNDEPALLISTQVVEAGVDLDFQVVYRALAPLDRIVQAAGRCNREGKRHAEESAVVIFEPAEGTAPRGSYRVGIEKARLMLQEGDLERLHQPQVYTEYFRRLFDDIDTDAHGIQDLREALCYEAVATRYRFIEPTVAVVVNYGDALVRLREHQAFPTRKSWQRLQPYIVNLMAHERARLSEWLEPAGENDDLFRWTGDYDTRHHRGIVEARYDPADLVVGGN